MTQTEQIQKVKELQEKIKVVQNSITETLTSNDGSIKVAVNGNNQILNIELLTPSNSELGIVLKEVINQALQNVSKRVKQTIAELTQGLIPAGMSL